MKPKNRAILKTDTDNTPPEIPRVKQAQACPACSGRGEVDDSDPYRDRDSRVSCKTCAGTGWLSGALLVFAILLLSFCSAHAATVTGTIRNRQGALVSTNIYFKAIQRPLFDTTPSVLPGWTLATNSAANGVFSTPLLAANYVVAVGGENKDSFIIAVPTNNATYDIQLLVTNLANYRYTGGQSFTNFVASLNGATSANQSLATDESGSDFAVTTAGNSHTFNLPPASATKTGKLTAADWSDFFARVTQAQLTAESNALITFSMAVSNAVYAAETTRNAAVSNALVSLETTRNAAVSNSVIAFAMAVSNAVYASETTRNAAVSNGAIALTITTSNTLYTAETARHLAVSNAAVAFAMTVSNSNYRIGTNLTATTSTAFGLYKQINGARLEFYGIEQGTNVVLFFNGSNIVINAVAATGGGGSSEDSFDSTTGSSFDSNTTPTFDSTL